MTARDRYRLVPATRTMHCDECGARLQSMRVERVSGDYRFVCATHPLPAALAGLEVVRVMRGHEWADVPATVAR